MLKALAIRFLLGRGYSVLKQYGEKTYYDVGNNCLCRVDVVKENYFEV